MTTRGPIRITGIKSYLFHPFTSNTNWTIQKHWAFVKIETDQGIEGWGEAFTVKGREQNIIQYFKALTPYLLGKNPFQIKQFMQLVYSKFAERRGGVDLFSAVSGIEQALWDIVGKNLNTPVYNLLGGPCRDQIRVYANGFSRGADTPEKMAQRAREVVELGFNAIKFYPFLNNETEKDAIAKVKAVREAVGLEVDILIDIWRLPEPSQAKRIARHLEEFNIYWYEEPVPSENLDVLSDIRRSINLPVVTGECLYTKSEFRDVLGKGAADILNPDVSSCGGILQFKEISAMAEPYYVMIAPHNFNSTAIGLAATLQVSAVIPNFLIAEYFICFSEAGDAISVEPLKVEGGYIELPKKPGLGLEINEDVVREHPFKEFPLEKW